MQTIKLFPLTATMLAGLFSTSLANTPQQTAQLRDGFNAEEKYMASCYACHSTGATGAPKVGAGNAEDWNLRLEKGLDAMVSNAVYGIGMMPAKGLCFDCTDDEMREIIEYMISSSQ